MCVAMSISAENTIVDNTFSFVGVGLGVLERTVDNVNYHIW